MRNRADLRIWKRLGKVSENQWDIITHLDEEPLQGLTLNQAVEKMRGRENSKIKLKIMRKGQDKPVEVTITRARIQVRSVRSRLEGDDVGFIRVTQFNEQ